MWLFTQNINTKHPFKTLDYKMIALFKVIRKKNILLKLQIPQALKIHNNFHLNLLQKTSIDLLIGQINELTLPVGINNKDK